MPITPADDKATIRAIIVNDAYLLSLGFSDKYTYNANTTTDKIESNNFQIYIFNSSSRKNPENEATIEPILQIDVSVPINKASKADFAIQQIIALLDGYEWENHSTMHVIAPSPTPLNCQSGLYTMSARFSYFTTKTTPKRTI